MEKKKKIYFIINPISGTKSKELIVQYIEQLIDSSLFDYDILKTQYAGHAAILAREAAKQQADAVVAVGGDGTVNEVACSLIHTRTALGIIPCGSGNGLARHLNIPMDSKRAIQLLNQYTIHCLDYGIINTHPFFCTCGVGFDAFISSKFAEAGKRGPLTYLENMLKEGLRYKPETYYIEDATGETRHEAFLIACANASQYGNNAYIAPDASMKDGLMDVIIMKPFNAIEAPQIAIQLFNRTLNLNSHIKTFRTKKITIHRQAEGVIHCDGDPLMTGKDIHVELIGKGLNVVVNPQAKTKSENLLQAFSNYFSELPFLHEDTRISKNLTINKALLQKLRKW